MLIFAAAKMTNMTKDECVSLLKKYMNILKDKYGITSLSPFGSTARGEQKEGSDIDLFVDTETPNPFLLMDAKEFLEEATGVSVDIRPQSSEPESPFKKTHFKGWNLYLLKPKVLQWSLKSRFWTDFPPELTRFIV